MRCDSYDVTCFGRNSPIIINGTATGTASNSIGYITDVRMNSTCDSYDVTSFGDVSKSYVSSAPSYTLDMQVQLDKSFDQKVIDALFSGTARVSITTGSNISDNQTNKEQITNMRLWEYAVIYVPQDDEGNEIKKEATIVTDVSTKLAQSEEAVRRSAIREVPADLDMDFVQVIVRPFGY